MQRQKRVLAVHDISGVGKCSLTVALPIISAAGAECAALPTAVLSTHTGGFTGFTCRDLTEDIAPITAHWKSLGIRFDAIYTGYLGSFDQIDLVAGLFDALAAPDTLIAVDPVMADDGRLYAAFGPDFPPAMKKLCARAGLIMPNITEAVLMLGEEYRPGPYTEDYINGLLARLEATFPARQIVLTGVSFDDTRLGAAARDTKAATTDFIFGPKIEGYYHGTGDVFGSALVGALTAGQPLAAACRAAVDFTVASIRTTCDAKTEPRYGVNFEANLPQYMKALGRL